MDTRFNALALCLVEGLGIRDMRWSMRCLRWKPMLRTRSLRCALWSSAKCSTPRVHVTRPYSSGVSTTSDFSMRTFSVNEAVSISYSSSLNRRSIPTRFGPVVYLRHNVGGLVDKTAQVQKLHCLFILVTCCFDNERRGKGCLLRCLQQHGFCLLL